jgi:hypothetical protein
MLWWFLILGVSTAAILWASMSVYLRVHRHMKESAKKDMGEPDKL